MCEWVKSGDNRIDPCMRSTISELQLKGIKTLGSCCGHGIYGPTIIMEENGKHIEYLSGIVIPRKRRFYKRDANGVYYVPEVVATNER